MKRILNVIKMHGTTIKIKDRKLFDYRMSFCSAIVMSSFSIK